MFLKKESRDRSKRLINKKIFKEKYMRENFNNYIIQPFFSS